MSNKRSTDDNIDEQQIKKFKDKEKEKEKNLPFENVYLQSLPNALMYEKSYMHRDVCSFIEVTNKSEYLISVDVLGFLKFWKKQPVGIEFVKTFKAHSELGCAAISVSHNGDYLCSVGFDKNVRVFDVNNFDLINSFKIPFIPLTCQWIGSKDSGLQRIAISSQESPIIYIYNAKGSSNTTTNNSNNNVTFTEETSAEDQDKQLLLAQVKIHKQPVHLMKYSETLNAMVSTDLSGIIEYWCVNEPFSEPEDLRFQYKIETDLYDMVSQKTYACSLEFSTNSKYFSIMGRDKKLRIFNYKTGKLYRVYDESYHVLNEIQKSDDPNYALDSGDFGKRMAVERDLDNHIDQFHNSVSNIFKQHSSTSQQQQQQGKQSSTPGYIVLPNLNILFDHDDNFIIYSTMIGIKIVNIKTNKVARLLGKIESSTRFMNLKLYQGKNEGNAFLGTKKQDSEPDPTVFCVAYKKQRFYMFTKREPEDTDNPDLGRDVFNEKVKKDDLLMGGGVGSASKTLPRNAVIHTTKGDIYLMLFPDECPKTVENFTTHAKNGYYDGVIFHRVIKGFVIQTGDPLGDGTGGTSIWGKEFEDEIHRSLRHDRPFTLSMANAGPGTNGSQFFITTAPQPRLDNKHTVFGRVYKGMETVVDIEKVKTDSEDKPLQDIHIMSIKISNQVPEEYLKKK
ncbi:WD40 repeat-containing protein [Tieghemostelium lacteum]|uniref:peptidylprolyl isomerase n=1 Tax=Tieghemostelium lacteum TaxID=361077 RepID=A0A152A5Z9_TIELA|nr:WD40 repeat-containing protein [Tieghemostelium lacteum]|eukprot:KYR01535.1 WD40 repeat-containing protein [Tieghemostelium lacteum]